MLDRAREEAPAGDFIREVPSAGGGEAVDSHAATLLGESLVGGNQAALLETIERGVERALIDLEHIGAALTNALRDRPPMERGVPDGLQDEQIERALEQIGARDLFDRVYGSDLVNTWKFGPEYYRAVLADSGVDPQLAAVVDDSPSAVSWARECGMRGFLVERRDGEDFDTAVVRTFGAVARATS